MVNLPLTLNLNADQRRLLVSQWGVGLASTPTGTVLTRTVTVSDNYGGTLGPVHLHLHRLLEVV